MGTATAGFSSACGGQHFIAPRIYRDQGKLADAVRQCQSPETLAARVRRVRSKGL